ncbi:ParB N-terminal domain-containing protein [Ponticoccus sp. SC2-23]|uniref:plasmid partitioning protein RepB C-terminal domain-containing protein n=1 Tax=Alexandriicola marinus TaxID=2081710 RepID=UPI000FD85863|nr:plasmid partitioning protein RepB C-terminal domain-containing protein [Alexandriicola marinus]MBM1221339.1 ParB N-terminal domain-containing protein [Ponticoccus sp. SC6-9]MBM1226380.1 ParB N-terminal domain-containing protein [Ponticoccus sp. SC6-15]MBM1230331.1 ParB N-terminal domain-containing protein [Ponticoccus sp. SC6-38]MBM1234854.1 ParB N-terminal domain-containing protein [Ponticoccus sp. SC6-45]MBM1239352.1 ParB N-terminal domain-containing protein [Ponticoccus sp. SC6-49]MBM12
MTKKVQLGFENDCVTIPVADILPVRVLSKSIKSSRKYTQITASIREIGLVEPPVVARNGDASGSWLLLDGHVRIEVLKDLGQEQVECLVSTDDEAFTYNKRISRIAPIQEHRMILKAIERGVSEEKIAAALDLNPRSVHRKVKLLDGICPEAVAILKDKACTAAVFTTLRKMIPLRQIEAAELMVNANNYSVAYISAILAGTPQAQLVEANKPKRINGVTPQAVARMEKELARLQEGITQIQDTYGEDHLQLTVLRGYVGKLLGNARVVRYLMQTRPEFLSEFQTIAEMESVVPAEVE